MFKILFKNIIKKESNILDNTILIIIILSAVIIGFETNNDLFSKYHSIFFVLDITVLSIFTAEIIIKMIAQGKNPFRYFYDPWNIFDFFIVMLCLLPYIFSNGHQDTHVFAALRLIRLGRVFRVFRVLRLITHLKPLQLLVETLIRSLPSMAYVVLLLSILFYIYAIIGCFLFGNFDDAHFGSLDNSLLTLTESISGSWPDYMEAIFVAKEKVIIDGNEVFKTIEYPFIVPLYFISFYFVGGLIILNLFIGVIVAELGTVKEQNEKDEIRENFQDDLDKESVTLIISLDNQIRIASETLKKLQMALDKNRSSSK